MFSSEESRLAKTAWPLSFYNLCSQFACMYYLSTKLIIQYFSEKKVFSITLPSFSIFFCRLKTSLIKDMNRVLAQSVNCKLRFFIQPDFRRSIGSRKIS